MRDHKRRRYGIEAAGAGFLAEHSVTIVLGPCPSCGAELKIGTAIHPITKKVTKAIAHPVPFCAYFGSTDAELVEQDVKRNEVS